MDEVSVSFTVFFDDPFWVGVIRREEEETFKVSKVTFGAEPKEVEVEDFILKRWYQLRFSPTLDNVKKSVEHSNPKRRQRMVRQEVGMKGIGTKSQQAIKLLREEDKIARKSKTRERRELEGKKQFELKQQKKKQKHKGR